jgi:hypothetical protein
LTHTSRQKGRKTPVSTYNKATTKESQNGIWLTTADIGKRLLCPDINIGIDKMKVVFPVIGPKLPLDQWDSKSIRKMKYGASETAHIHVPTDLHGECSIGYNCHPVKGRIGWVEFNPSKMMHSDGHLADIGEAYECLDHVLTIATGYLNFYVEAESVSFHRLDVTVDLSPVIDLQRALYLARSARPYLRGKPELTLNQKTLELETVMFKTKRTGTVLFYDKSAEAGLDEPTLRIEVQVSRRELMKKGPRHLGEFSLDLLRPLFLDRVATFATLCMGTPKAQTDQILQNKNDTKHLVLVAGRELLGANGLEIPKTGHFVKLDRKFKKNYPYNTVCDLL